MESEIFLVDWDRLDYDNLKIYVFGPKPNKILRIERVLKMLSG